MSRGVGGTLAMLMACIVLLGAATGPADGIPASARTEMQKGGTLRLARFSDVDFVDPALAYTTWSLPFAYATCAKLFNYPDRAGAAGARLVPEVVDRWTVSNDGRTYTFSLKRTFRFHTGARVTAQSFAAAFNRVAQPKLASPARPYMREIVGAQAVIDGKAQTISGIRVLGPFRLQIRLTKPLGDFTARLTMPFFCPILPNTPVDPAGIDNPAGSGPYYVAERVVNQRVVLKRNPFYRGDRPANVDQVVFTAGVPQQACLTAVEEDRIDHCLTLSIPPTAYRTLHEKYGINRPGGQFFVGPGLTTWFVAFNHDRPAFTGPGQIPLKKAINYAIDRPALARAFGYLAGKRTDQILPPALSRPESIYPLTGADPSTARKWLERARSKPKQLVLYASSGSVGVPLTQVLVFNLKQIGIDVEVKYFDTATLWEKAATRAEPYDIIELGFAADYSDGAAFFIPLLAGTQGGINLSDARLARRVAAASRLTGEARRRAWADLDVELMRNDPPWAPFVHTQNRTLVSKSTGCVVLHPVYVFDIAAACKK